MDNKKRLIDADAFMVEVCATCNVPYGMCVGCAVSNILEGILNKQPTIDAVEVVHGRWEKSEDSYFDLHIIKCSECREEWCFEESGDVVALHYKYCPNCGAKMDGERKGNG